MPLENKGLALIREYENKKAVDSLESALCGTVGVLGSIGTFLYYTDFFRNGNTMGGLGMNWQPSWTPGYDANHDGAFGLDDFAYLGGYIAATYLGVQAVKKIAQPIAQKWKAWRHESSGEKARDEEFNANYSTLAHRLLAGEEVPSGLHQDYKDSLGLDFLIDDLSKNLGERKGTAADLERRWPGLVAPLVREHFEKVDYTPESPINTYLELLRMEDLINLGNHYVESGRWEQAEIFIDDRLTKFDPGKIEPLIQFPIIRIRNKIANAYYTAGRLTDAERVWKLLGNKEKLKNLSAAYRKAGDESNAARVFTEHWQ